MGNFRDIVTNLFGHREQRLVEDRIDNIKEASDIAIKKADMLAQSKSELVKAFDTFNDRIVVELSKAEQNGAKQAITKRFDRYESSFLNDLGEIEKALYDANITMIHTLEDAIDKVPSNDPDLFLYKSRLYDIQGVGFSNHFRGLNFDCDVDNMSFNETCEMLSKAIDDGCLEKKDDRPFVLSEHDFQQTVVTLAKAKEESLLTEEQLEKARRNLFNNHYS